MDSNGGERQALLAAVETFSAQTTSVVHLFARSSCMPTGQCLQPPSCAAPPGAFPPPLLPGGACPPAPSLPCMHCQPSPLVSPGPPDPDWELVSSSSEEGEGGTELQQEAEALANSFRLGEPSPPHSGPSSSAPGSPTSAELGPLRGAAGEPAPGSPQRPQRLQLLAAPLPAPDWPCPPPTSSGSTASAGPPGAGSAESAAGRGSPRRFATLGGSPTAQEAVASSSSAEDVCLRVVRSDDLQALEGAVAALEKR